MARILGPEYFFGRQHSLAGFPGQGASQVLTSWGREVESGKTPEVGAEERCRGYFPDDDFEFWSAFTGTQAALESIFSGARGT